MDSYEINKILGALLFTCLCLLSLNIAAGAMFAPHKPAKPGFEVAVTEQKQDAAGGRARAAGADREAARQPRRSRRARPRPRSAPPATPSARASRTASGRTSTAWSGASAARMPGFNYSAGMKAKPGKWTIEDLNAFLLNPKGFIPGTSMSFAGVPRGSERADVIAYLNSKSDSPAPLPKAAEAPAGKAGAGAGRNEDAVSRICSCCSAAVLRQEATPVRRFARSVWRRITTP